VKRKPELERMIVRWFEEKLRAEAGLVFSPTRLGAASAKGGTRDAVLTTSFERSNHSNEQEQRGRPDGDGT
jgi:hypothetical protein